MILEGNLLKMETENGSPIQYKLVIGDEKLSLNSLIGTNIKMSFGGQINCISCSKRTKKSYNQGFCFQCMQTSPMADENIIRPELSMAQFGIARDMEWAETHDLIEHYVYLSLTSEVKVGVTRHHQIPTRWIDQGASAAMIIAKTPNRHISGIIESELKKHVADKTNWKQMLMGENENQSLLYDVKGKVSEWLHPELQQYLVKDEQIQELVYPLEQYPASIEALNFDKNPIVEGVLTGIKGQYLYLDETKVINIRRHNGYYINLEYSL